ncbi:DUF6114 domain-containing protein [Streptomyces netropsis]|uniref:Integral membrane protein n=1 Tax=Streptomyces netropsis TaxID=55404 RepID=A0A7W7PC04_STRNE|nr:DUF6114 domain-containing protein [Streptomyces netropsis]MBB4884509.1 hypothetical protein [Streptomyces netropsis]GGR03162.1 hypothetical protein GCM10010219_04020 [Streptomyces netropsis]
MATASRRGTEPGTARRSPWAAWRQWRKGRPFWGGLATIVAGAEISAIPLAPLKIMLHQGIAGIPSVLMGLVMVLMGLTAWFAPQYRTLAGVLTVMVATAALVMSNLGGFLFGTIIGVIGGGMVFAWQPLPTGPDPGPESGPAPETTSGHDPAPDQGPDAVTPPTLGTEQPPGSRPTR